MRWEFLRRRPEGSGGIYSQMSPTWRPTASDTGWHSGRNTPEEPAAEALAGHQGPRSESRGQPPAAVCDPPAQWVEERPVECDTRIPPSRRPIAVEDDQAGDESSYSVSPLVTPGESLSQTLRKPKPLPSLETQFQPVTDHSVPAVIEMVDVELGSYFMAPVSEPKLTNPEEVQEAIRGLKVSKAPGPNGIPNRALKHLPQRAVSLLVLIFNAILLTHHFPTAWKHARVISILKPGKDPALPSSYRPISLLDTIGKIFEKILLARILHEVSVRGLMRDEQFGFRPRHSTSLQLARLVERITRNFGEKRLTGAVFLDVAKAFDTVWIEGLLYKLTLLNFPSYIVHTISSYLRGRTFEESFNTATSSRRGWGGSGWIDLTCPLQSVCQRHALILAPRRVIPLCGWHGHNSHVPQADPARQLHGVLTQRPSMVVERMENHQKCL